MTLVAFLISYTHTPITFATEINLPEGADSKLLQHVLFTVILSKARIVVELSLRSELDMAGITEKRSPALSRNREACSVTTIMPNWVFTVGIKTLSHIILQGVFRGSPSREQGLGATPTPSGSAAPFPNRKS